MLWLQSVSSEIRLWSVFNWPRTNHSITWFKHKTNICWNSHFVCVSISQGLAEAEEDAKKRRKRQKKHKRKMKKMTRKLCKAEMILSNMTKCYQMLNSKVRITGDNAGSFPPPWLPSWDPASWSFDFTLSYPAAAETSLAAECCSWGFYNYWLFVKFPSDVYISYSAHWKRQFEGKQRELPHTYSTHYYVRI